MTSWRLSPIETAPLDGRDVLVWDGHRFSVAFYVAENGAGKADIDPADWADGCRWVTRIHSPYADYAPPIWPTYWVPEGLH